MKKENVFGEQLRRLREKKRISRKVLGELCGLSKNAIAKYEQGTREPSFETLMEIADFFGVSIDFLLGRKKF